MDNELLKLLNVDRDAIAVNRGFYFQYLCLLKRWIENFIGDLDSDLYSEVGEDIKEVGDRLVFTQIKCYTQSFSLSSKEVKSAIFNFFVLYLTERDAVPGIHFTFETNTGIAPREKLLTAWADRGPAWDPGLKGAVNSKILEIILSQAKKRKDRRMGSLSDGPREKEHAKKLFSNFDQEIKQFDLFDFIERLSWDFGNQSPEEAIIKITEEIKVLLMHQKFQGKPSGILMDVFLSEIYRCSQQTAPELRKLNNYRISTLLAIHNEELENYVNKNLIRLLDGKFLIILQAIQELQKKQFSFDQQLENIRADVQKRSRNGLPRQLTSIPYIQRTGVVGREEDVRSITNSLNETKNLTICGGGGMGKTTLAKLFVQESADMFDHIIWLNVQGDLIMTIINDTSLRFHFPFHDNGGSPENQFGDLLIFLREVPGDNLIVVNNFQGVHPALVQLLDLVNWKVIITTRSLIPDVPSIKVGALNLKKAIQLYRKHEPDKPALEEEFDSLFEKIGYNTLAIELIAKTIGNSLDLTASKFLEYLDTQRLDDFDLEIDIDVDGTDQGSSLLKVLQQTFNISDLDNLDQYYLIFFAMLPSENIKITELVEWFGKDHEKQNKVQFPNLINRLKKLGWLEREGDNVSMHKMLQQIIIYNERKDLSPFVGFGNQMGWLTRRLSEGISSDPSKALRLLKYGESILDSIKEPYRSSVYQPLLVIENEVLNIYNWSGKVDNIDRWKGLMTRAENYLDRENELLGVIYNNYALAAGQQGIHDDAIIYFRKAIAILKKYGQKMIPQLLYATCNLSKAYFETGEHTKVRATREASAALRKQYNLRQDPSLPIEANIMGLMYQRIGKFGDSAKYFELAVSSHYSLPKDKRNDINLVLFLNNLAFNYLLDGKDEFAVQSVNKALDELKELNISNTVALPEIINTLIMIAEKLGEHVRAEQLRNILNSLTKTVDPRQAKKAGPGNPS